MPSGFSGIAHSLVLPHAGRLRSALRAGIRGVTDAPGRMAAFVWSAPQPAMSAWEIAAERSGGRRGDRNRGWSSGRGSGRSGGEEVVFPSVAMALAAAPAAHDARLAELVDARDLKSLVPAGTCRFESGSGHHCRRGGIGRTERRGHHHCGAQDSQNVLQGPPHSSCGTTRRAGGWEERTTDGHGQTQIDS